MGLLFQGSIPWVGIGLIALLFVLTILIRWYSLNLSVQSYGEAMPMNKQMNTVISLLETSWAFGVSYLAGALPT